MKIFLFILVDPPLPILTARERFEIGHHANTAPVAMEAIKQQKSLDIFCKSSMARNLFDNKSKINIGDAFERWRHGVKWHEVTVLLLRWKLPKPCVCCSYQCDCRDTGFEGIHCEVDIPECASSPCQHGAMCMEGVRGYTCLCWSGREWHTMQQNISSLTHGYYDIWFVCPQNKKSNIMFSYSVRSVH